MAAPIKNKLDYFPLDCDFFNDPKIKGLRAKLRNDGLIVYLYIISLIYGDHGYYVEFDKFTILGVADTVHVSEEDVIKFLDFAVDDSLLFDNSIYNKCGILTSKAVQRRFQKVKKVVGAKRKVNVRADLWLLSETETEPYIEIVGEHPPIIADKSEKNGDLSSDLSVKESKVKKSKVKENKNKYADDVFMTEKEYEKLVEDHPKAFVDKCIEVLNNYKQSTGRTYKSDYHAILSWVSDKVSKEHPELLKQKQTSPANMFENPWSDEIGKAGIR